MDTEELLAALGGAENVIEQEPCITRLRIRVADPGLVDADAIEQLGARGVRSTGNTIQVIIGPQADGISDELAKLLPTAASQPGGLEPPATDPQSHTVDLLVGKGRN